MALTEDRNTARREIAPRSFPAKGNTTFHAGAIGCMAGDGYATPGATATGLTALGRIEVHLASAAGDGTDSVTVRAGIFRWSNSAAADEIGDADVGRTCWIVDDHTVALTDGGGTRSPAGRIDGVDDLGVWVAMGLDPRARLTEERVWLAIGGIELDGTAAYRIPSPVAGTVTRITTILEGALTTGDATVTGRIGATPITGGAITITQAASAAGDVDSVTPSAANTVGVGADINLVVGGTNDASVTARAVIEITL